MNTSALSHRACPSFAWPIPLLLPSIEEPCCSSLEVPSISKDLMLVDPFCLLTRRLSLGLYLSIIASACRHFDERLISLSCWSCLALEAWWVLVSDLLVVLLPEASMADFSAILADAWAAALSFAYVAQSRFIPASFIDMLEHRNQVLSTSSSRSCPRQL